MAEHSLIIDISQYTLKAGDEIQRRVTALIHRRNGTLPCYSLKKSLRCASLINSVENNGLYHAFLKAAYSGRYSVLEDELERATVSREHDRLILNGISSGALRLNCIFFYVPGHYVDLHLFNVESELINVEFGDALLNDRFEMY